MNTKFEFFCLFIWFFTQSICLVFSQPDLVLKFKNYSLQDVKYLKDFVSAIKQESSLAQESVPDSSKNAGISSSNTAETSLFLIYADIAIHDSIIYYLNTTELNLLPLNDTYNLTKPDSALLYAEVKTDKQHVCTISVQNDDFNVQYKYSRLFQRNANINITIKTGRQTFVSEVCLEVVLSIGAESVMFCYKLAATHKPPQSRHAKTSKTLKTWTAMLKNHRNEEKIDHRLKTSFSSSSYYDLIEYSTTTQKTNMLTVNPLHVKRVLVNKYVLPQNGNINFKWEKNPNAPSGKQTVNLTINSDKQNHLFKLKIIGNKAQLPRYLRVLLNIERIDFYLVIDTNYARTELDDTFVVYFYGASEKIKLYKIIDFAYTNFKEAPDLPWKEIMYEKIDKSSIRNLNSMKNLLQFGQLISLQEAFYLYLFPLEPSKRYGKVTVHILYLNEVLPVKGALQIKVTPEAKKFEPIRFIHKNQTSNGWQFKVETYVRCDSAIKISFPNDTLKFEDETSTNPPQKSCN